MLETTYKITGKTTGQFTFKFDANGYLVHYSYEGAPLTEQQHKWLFPKAPAPLRLPKTEADIKTWANIKEFTITKGEPDLSFENFWNTYNNKAKKLKAEQIWNKLSNDDKFNAITFIKRYDNWLRLKGTAKALPDTYLNQKRWLDEL